MEKILIIHNHSLRASYGASWVLLRSIDYFKRYFSVIEYSCLKKQNKWRTFFLNLFLFAGSLSGKDIKNILNIIAMQKIMCIYCDTSLHGRVVKRIRKKYPNINIVVNYHNAEKKYFYDLIKVNGLVYSPLYFSALYNEALSRKYADMSIFISRSDCISEGMEGCKSIIIPVLLKDTWTVGKQRNTETGYALFVGSAFFANIEAVRYIINNIAPNVACNFRIVGSGMKNTFCGYKILQNVKIDDYIEDLNTVYDGAALVIAPVFYGSGMKVKIAEALMHGKKILATANALSGYEIDGISSCIRCNNIDDFIREIKINNSLKLFYKESRNLFLEKYSYDKIDKYYSPIFNYFSQ